MGKMKKTGALVVIGLLAFQLGAGILIPSMRSDDPADRPVTDSTSSPVGLSPEIGTGEIPEPESPNPGEDQPLTQESAETTDEFQLGGYEGKHTASDDDVIAPTPSTDLETTEAPETDDPISAVPETEDTSPILPPPAAPLTSEGQGGLYDIADPDPSYGYKVVEVTGSDRDLLERLVMGEAGDQGFIGAAMVAQCIKDAMTYEGYTSVAAVRKGMKYSGSVSNKPNEDVKKAVAYIFDEGGYAVQHPMLYFYYSRNGINKNNFHETQELVVQYKDHRYFWKK